MSVTLRRSLVFIVFCACVAFAGALLETWHYGFGWHDQQRLYQLVLLITVAGAALFLPLQALPRRAFVLLLALFTLGLWSALVAAWPDWAFKEWGRYLGLTLLVLVFGQLAQKTAAQLFLVYLLATAAFFSAFQFAVYYLMAFLTGIYMLDADLLFNGFSNPRFLGQFQMLLMPVLAYLVLHHWQQGKRHPKKIAAVFFVVLAVHWCIALTLGGRGLWLGLATGHLALLAIAPRFWRLPAMQAGAAVLGFLLYYIMFYLIPAWLDLAPTLRDSLRTSLSGREAIWLWAWDMAVANPWLGVGPMHYSAVVNSIAAHPHQVVLQWLAEWGFIATGLAIIIAGWGVIHGLTYLRRPVAEPLDGALWLSIIGALVLAQVDGVFVMPYTETWLAILIGLALARWAQLDVAGKWQTYSLRLLAVPAILILGNVLINEVPTLPQDSEAHMEKHHTGYTPRFWLQGWIPMDGVEIKD